MAMQAKLTSIYQQKKPFMDGPADSGKRKAGGNLRVQALLAQEAKRQCSDPSGEQQENAAPVAAGEQPPATDFSGFYNILQHDKQQQQQQQPFSAGPGALATPPPPQQPQQQQQQPQQEGLLERLLQQHSLGSRPAPPDEHQAGGLRHLDTSCDGFWRAPDQLAVAGAGGASCAGSASTAAAAAAGARERWHLASLQGVPWDWSVKRRVRVASVEPLLLLQQARAAGLGPQCQAVAACGVSQPAEALSPQERLSQLLLQWQHPPAPLPAASISSLRDGGGGAPAAAGGVAEAHAALLKQRVETWRDALRGAYASLRHGHCPVLYVCGQAFRQSFTAVLCCPRLLGNTRVSGVVSRTNRQLRAHLAAFGAEGVLAGSLEGTQQQPAAAAARPQQPAAGVADGQPGSQLLLSGALAVQGLYAALLALPWCSTELASDVPLIAAPAPFVHAQLCSLRLEALPDAVLEQQQQQQQQPLRRVGSGAAAAPPHQPLHYAELRGSSCVLPWTLHRLLQLLHDTQGASGFDAHLDTEAAACVNVLPDTWAAAEAALGVAAGKPPAAAAGGSTGRRGRRASAAGAAQAPWQPQGAGLTPEEAAGWQESAGLLQGRALKQLHAEAGGQLAGRLG